MSGKVRNQPKTQFLAKNRSGSIEEEEEYEEKWTQYTAKTENGRKGFDSVEKTQWSQLERCWFGWGVIWSEVFFLLCKKDWILFLGFWGLFVVAEKNQSPLSLLLRICQKAVWLWFYFTARHPLCLWCFVIQEVFRGFFSSVLHWLNQDSWSTGPTPMKIKGQLRQLDNPGHSVGWLWYIRSERLKMNIKISNDWVVIKCCWWRSDKSSFTDFCFYFILSSGKMVSPIRSSRSFTAWLRTD